MTSGDLVVLDDIDRHLAVAGSDIRAIRALEEIAEAAKRYAISHDQKVAASLAKLRIARHGGQVLIGMAARGERDSGGGGDRRSPFRDGSVKLADLGLTVQRSKRWQDVARMTPDEYEKRERAIEEQNKDAELVDRQAQDRRARAIRPGGDDAAGTGWQIIAGDFHDAVTDESVDLILTDPPYPEESAALWSDLGEWAARVLQPGGILVALSGKIHLDDRMRRLGEHLSYGWVYAHPLDGSNTRILARHVAQEWKPFLAYSKGPWPSGRIDWHGDMLPAGPRDKGEYHWQQAVEPAAALVDRLTSLGYVVADPFCGTGTYGVAAITTGRQFIGIDIDADRVAIATRRLRECE
jgi:site-specific DNA-methyltransferase (adenine-specific)